MTTLPTLRVPPGGVNMRGQTRASTFNPDRRKTFGRTSRAHGSRPLRIAIVSDAIFPYNKGGKEVRYEEISRRLAAMGATVDVYTMQWWNGPKHRVSNGVNFHAVCAHRDLYAGSRRSISQAVVFALACCKLLTCNVDVIEADHMPYLQLFTLRIVAWLKRCQLVVTWHEVWGREYWRAYLGPLGSIAALIERIAMRLPDHIVADVSETRDRLLRNGVRYDALSVVPIGVDIEAIERTSRSSSGFDVVCVGRLLEHKRIDVVIEAIAIARDSGVMLTAGIIGEGPEFANLQQQVSRLQLETSVTFLGRVEAHAEVWSLIKAAKMLAVPSVREGFGIVVLEALACGIPVVCSDHADNQARRLVHEGLTGTLCPSTPQSFAHAMTNMIERPVDVAHHRAIALQPFAWDSIIDSLETLYSSRPLVLVPQ